MTTTTAELWERAAVAYERMARAYAGRPDQTYCEIQAEVCRAKAKMARRAERSA